MSGPNNINRNAPVDPYNNMDDWLNDDQDSSLSEDPTDFTNDDYGSDYQGAQGYAPMSMSGKEAAEQINTLFNQIKKDSSIPNVEKNKQLKELRALYDQARNYGRNPVPNAIMNELSAFEANSISNLGMEGVEGDEEGGTNPATLKKDLNDFKATIQANPNLSETKKQQYLAKITQWLSGLDLKTLDAATIIPLFDAMKTQITEASAFSPVAQRLSEATGRSAEEIDALLESHGIDAANLPNPPDSRIAELLNDPELSDALGSAQQGVSDSFNALKEGTERAVRDANSTSDARAAGNTSSAYSDWSMYEKVQRLYEHGDELNTGVTNARKTLANETAKILSALYGTSVSASTDAAKAGSINFNGNDINVCTSSLSGNINFSSTTTIDWPTVTRPTAQVDCEGSGATGHPQWMDDKGYPSASYDGSNEVGYSS